MAQFGGEVTLKQRRMQTTEPPPTFQDQNSTRSMALDRHPRHYQQSHAQDCCCATCKVHARHCTCPSCEIHLSSVKHSRGPGSCICTWCGVEPRDCSCRSDESSSTTPEPGYRPARHESSNYTNFLAYGSVSIHDPYDSSSPGIPSGAAESYSSSSGRYPYGDSSHRDLNPSYAIFSPDRTTSPGYHPSPSHPSSTDYSGYPQLTSYTSSPYERSSSYNTSSGYRSESSYYSRSNDVGYPLDAGRSIHDRNVREASLD